MLFRSEGAPAAVISDEQQLRRAVMSCLLWEDQFYESGEDIAARITQLALAQPASVVATLAVQARDEMAFREIVERYQAKVFSIIYGILRNRNDAEDIAQQVFAKVYFSIRNFDFRSSLLTWIYKITVNECYDYLRKKRVRKLVYESDFSEDEAKRLSAAEPATDQSAPADVQLAQRDLVVKLLDRKSTRLNSSH